MPGKVWTSSESSAPRIAFSPDAHLGRAPVDSIYHHWIWIGKLENCLVQSTPAERSTTMLIAATRISAAIRMMTAVGKIGISNYGAEG